MCNFSEVTYQSRPSQTNLVDQLLMSRKQITMTLSMAIADMEREDMITKIAFKEKIDFMTTRFSRGDKGECSLHFSTNLDGVLEVTKQRRVSPVPSLINNLHLV